MNGDFVDGNDDHENIFTIAHEISHIALLHCTIKTIDGKPAIRTSQHGDRLRHQRQSD